MVQIFKLSGFYFLNNITKNPIVLGQVIKKTIQFYFFSQFIFEERNSRTDKAK